MMLRIAVLACVLLAVSGEKCCSHDDRMAVLHAWETVWTPEFSDRKIAIMQEMMKRFFELAPDAQAAFVRVGGEDVNSEAFKGHSMRIGTGLDLIINSEHNTDVLFEQLHHMGNKHATYEGVTAEHFEMMRTALEEVLPQAIQCFDVEAFERCISVAHHEIEHMLPH